MTVVGGGEGTMNIETGVFTTVTSGYYIVTFSAHADVHARDSTDMYLFHNGALDRTRITDKR